jgi:hypothetical protein
MDGLGVEQRGGLFAGACAGAERQQWHWVIERTTLIGWAIE